MLLPWSLFMKWIDNEHILKKLNKTQDNSFLINSYSSTKFDTNEFGNELISNNNEE